MALEQQNQFHLTQVKKTKKTSVHDPRIHAHPNKHKYTFTAYSPFFPGLLVMLIHTAAYHYASKVTVNSKIKDYLCQ